MKKLVLEFMGCDDWDRPVYKCEDRLYVDVDPRANRHYDICTKSNNEFYGEPDWSIPEDTEVEFTPRRMTW